MNKFFRSEQGSVSTYFIIILTAIFVFQAVLIDFVRIQLAERETEKAVKAAVRSTMSAFNQDLKSYGLFGLTLGEEEMQKVYKQVLQHNVSLMGEHAKFVTLQEENKASVQQVFSLANHHIIERQILEEMKYVAPIELTRSIIDKFQHAQKDIQETKVYSDHAVQMDKLVEQRETQMDDAWQEIKEWHHDLTARHNKYNKDVQALNQLSDKVGNADKDEVKRKIKSLQKKIDDAEDDDEEPDPDWKKDLRKMKRLLDDIEDYDDLLADLKQQMADDVKQADAQKTKIVTHLKEAKRLDLEIEQLKSQISANSPGSSEDNMNDIFQTVHVYGEAYFQDDIQSIESIYALLIVTNGQLQNVTGRGSITLDNRYSVNINTFNNDKQAREQLRQTNSSNLKNRKDEAKRNAKEQMNKAKKRLFDSCKQDSSKHYDHLEGSDGYYQTYLNYNQSTDSNDTNRPTPSLDGAAEDEAKETLSFLENGLSLMESLRDELYVNEYALVNFNYLTYDKESQTDKKMTFSEPANHPLPLQEVEYLLYGLSSCEANISAAYAEMYGVRLAFRLTEALLDPTIRAAAAGLPLLAFLLALADGAVKAYADMEELINGKEVELMSKLANIKLSYKDYLRLFLFLHSNDQKQLSRIQALIQLNTNTDLTHAYTYIRGSTQMSVRLWFMPQVINWIGQLNHVNGQLKQRDYLITSTADFSY